MTNAWRQLLCAIGVTAMGLSAITPAAQAQRLTIEPTNFTTTAGSLGGSWFIMTTAMWEIFKRNIDGLAYATVPGGAISNPIAIQSGAAQFGMGFTTTLAASVKGVEPYNKPLPDIRGIAALNTRLPLHFWMRADYDVTTLRALAETGESFDLGTGPRGTGAELSTDRALARHGLSYDEIKDRGGSVTHAPFRELVDRMKDGHIDMMVYNDFIGQPLFVELLSSRDVVLLEMDPAVIEALGADFNYGPDVIKAGSYDGLDREIPTISRDSILICHKDMPDDLVYTMVSLLFENVDELASAYRPLEKLDPAVGIEMPVPMHPGAERYYRERGLIE